MPSITSVPDGEIFATDPNGVKLMKVSKDYCVAIYPENAEISGPMRTAYALADPRWQPAAHDPDLVARALTWKDAHRLRPLY